MNRTTFMDNTGNIVLSTENSLVKACSIGVAFNYSHEANEWLAFYYNYFEDNNWEYENIQGLEIYKKIMFMQLLLEHQEERTGKLFL